MLLLYVTKDVLGGVLEMRLSYSKANFVASAGIDEGWGQLLGRKSKPGLPGPWETALEKGTK